MGDQVFDGFGGIREKFAVANASLISDSGQIFSCDLPSRADGWAPRNFRNGVSTIFARELTLAAQHNSRDD